MDGLENAIAEWRARMLGGDAMDRDTVRELESHLRDAFETHVANGMEWETAFEKAKLELGDAEHLNEEFGKVHPQAPWARRVLWLLSGYAIIMFGLAMVGFVGGFAEKLTFEAFPEARVPLPVPVEIIVKQENPWNDLSLGTHVIESVPLMSVVRIVARVLALALVCWWGLRWRRGRTPRLDRWLGDRTSLTKLVFLIGLIVFLQFGADGAYRHLFDPSIYTAGIPAYYTLNFLLWPFETMARTALLITMIALAASSRPRNGIDSDLRNWTFAGYFAVDATLLLATTLASTLGVVLVVFVPAATDSSAMLNFWPLKFPSVTLATGIQIYFEIIFLVSVLAMLIASLRREGRFGTSMASFISRRWRTFLAMWCLWTFGWSTVGAIMSHLYATDPNLAPLDFGLPWIGLSVLRISSVFHTLFWAGLIALAILAHARNCPVRTRHPSDLLDA